MPCTHLAHHEQESVIVVSIIITIILIIILHTIIPIDVVIITIITTVVIKTKQNAIINIVVTIIIIVVIIIIIIMMIVVICTLACRGKEKNAQEGHGAVAPVDPMIIPEAIFMHMEKVQGAISIPSELTKPQKKLYEMIWRHTLASQMKIAHLNQVGRQLYGSLLYSGITSGHAVSCLMH